MNGRGTPALLVLAKAGVAYTVHPYQHNPASRSFGEEAAAALAVPPARVFKTLLVDVDGQLVVAVVPVSGSLDLKALAKLSGNRKTDTVPLKEVQPLTGYMRGGVTAIGGKKNYPVFVDETIELFEVVAVSAGVRGTQILIAPADYLRAVGATVGAIATFT